MLFTFSVSVYNFRYYSNLANVDIVFFYIGCLSVHFSGSTRQLAVPCLSNSLQRCSQIIHRLKTLLTPPTSEMFTKVYKNLTWSLGLSLLLLLSVGDVSHETERLI